MVERTRSWILRSLVLSGIGAAAACSSSGDGGWTATSSSQTLGNAPAPGAMTMAMTPTWASSKSFAGRVDGGATVSLQVHLAMRNLAGAKALLAQISDPDNAMYGQFLSDADFAAQFAPTPMDVAVVQMHLESHGLTVTGAPSNNAFLTVQGTAANVESAFGTRLGQYTVGTEVRQAPMDAVTLPAEVGSRVSTVLGLATPSKMTSRLVPQSALLPAAAAPPPCSEFSGETLDTTDPAFGSGYPSPMPYASCGYRPAELRAGYGLTTVVRGGNDGTGQTIAIVDAWTPPTLVEDAQTYFGIEDADYPLATSQISLVVGPGAVQTPNKGWYGESTLDVETVHAIAPGANIVYMGAASDNDPDLIAGINAIVTGHLATLISNSYGGIEQQTTDFVAWESVVLQANLKGIGVYFASGDSGDESQNNGGTPSADFPASLTEVTAVGATSLALGRADDVVFQTGWETGVSWLTAPTLADGGADPDGGPSTWQPPAPGEWYFGAGGGVSELYLQPSWQAGIVPASLSTFMNATARTIPDVSMLGDPMTGYLVGMTSPRSGQYSEEVIGGTSLACPMFTATMALAQQHAHKTFGAANPALYKAYKKGAFTDIAPGSPEGVAAATGVITTFDYHGPENTNATAVGYDTVTGLGVPNGSSFLSALK
jgi:subtilase family serine protease